MMHLEIVTPEAVVFSSNIDSVLVPGIDGEFQLLNNHANIVSVLKNGTIKIHIHSQESIDLEKLNKALVPHTDDKNTLTMAIHSGTIELKENKAVILVD